MVTIKERGAAAWERLHKAVAETRRLQDEAVAEARRRGDMIDATWERLNKAITETRKQQDAELAAAKKRFDEESPA